MTEMRFEGVTMPGFYAQLYGWSVTLPIRFRQKIGDPDENGCWPWLGFIDKAGYGRIRLGGRDSESGYAHQVSYQLHIGPIPPGLVIDHVRKSGCRRRDCVNPAHLEPVTSRENIMRGVAPTVLLSLAGKCRNGHPASESYRRLSTGRVVYCRICRREARANASR